MKTVSFHNLTTEAQTRLLELQRYGTDKLVFHTSKRLRQVLMFVGGNCGLVILFLLTNNYLWTTTITIFLSAFTVATTYLLVRNGIAVAASRFSATKDFFAVTEAYVLKVSGGVISFYELDELDSVGYSNRVQKTHFGSHALDLVCGNIRYYVHLKSEIAAADAYDHITDNRKLFIEAVHRKDSKFLKNHLFIETVDTDDSLSQPTLKRPKSQLVIALLSLGLSFIAVFSAVSLNNYFDDKKSWEDAVSIGKASAFRTYMKGHKNHERS